MTIRYIRFFLGLLCFSIIITPVQAQKEKKDGVKSSVKPVPFDKQLKVFTELGFTFNEGAGVADLRRWSDSNAYENQPFSLLYTTLGQAIEREPWTPLTNKCWNFDTEAINDEGDYADILKNLERISRGELKFENIKDHIDLPHQKASVSFSFMGKDYNWNMKVDEEWVDMDFFVKLIALVKTSGKSGRYTFFDTGGQDAVIGYETPEGLEQIKKATGLSISWLE